MEPLVIDWAKEGAKMARIVRDIHLLLIIIFLSRSYDNFFSQVNSAEGLLPNDEFISQFLKDPLKYKFDGQTLTKCDFLKGRLPKYFFLKICSSGGKKTIHKVSAASIVRNYHPRTSLRLLKQRNIQVTPNVPVTLHEYSKQVYRYINIKYSRSISSTSIFLKVYQYL